MSTSTKRWQWLAVFVASCSASTAWGQLPAQKISPMNQLGRAWGFGIGDGYHECPDCQKPGLLRQKTNWLDKIDPLKSTLYGESCAPCQTPGLVSQPGYSTTVLPPSPQMYQQFAAPIETPLPGSTNSVPWTPPAAPSYNYPQEPRREAAPSPFPDPNTSLPSNEQGFRDLNSQPRNFPQPASPVPDPGRAELERGDDLLDEGPQRSAPELIPPAPPLRQRQKDDRPLGEMPDSWSQPKNDPKPANPLPNDDDLNLLPESTDLPPVTQRSSVPTYNASVAIGQQAQLHRSRSLLDREYAYPSYRVQTVQNPYAPSNMQQHSLPNTNRYR